MIPNGKFPMKKIGLGLLAFFLTVTVLFGGYTALQRVRYGNLDGKRWEKQGIAAFRTRPEGDNVVLEVEAGAIKDFRLTMEELIRQVEKGRGQRVVRVDFLQPASSKLEKVYDRLSFTLAEVKATGRYTLLPAAAELIAAEEKVRVGIEVGDRFIFVRLEQGKDRLYRVVGLPTVGSSVLVMTGGGR